MKDYSTYTVEEFALDESFARWTLSQSPEDAIFWQNWLEQHPETTQTIRRAQLLLLSIQEKPFLDITDKQVEADIEQVVTQIRQAQASVEPPFAVQYNWLRWAQVAAVVVLLAGLGWWTFGLRQSSVSGIAHTNEKESRANWMNTTHQPQRIALTDGSVVTLSPNSQFTYRDSATGHRVVHLTGEAFFSVTRNPSRPFLVYAGDVVTKVLGTSFWVKAFKEDGGVRVSVRTGKVSVFTRKTFGQQASQLPKSMEGVVLTPNQQVFFAHAESTFQKSFVAEPVKINPAISEQQFEFTMTPVADVFNRLEQAYGVVIIYDKALLKECQLTASLSDETLFEKLQLICQGIGATYELVDAQIIINSQGCN